MSHSRLVPKAVLNYEMLMKMLSFLLLSNAVTAIAIITPVSSQPQTSRTLRYAKYKGAWFEIDYPMGWKVTPSLRESPNLAASAESAFFRSPDGAVEFYIFSPEWNGDPKDIQLDPKREKLFLHHVESASRGKMTNGGYLANVMANWYTVRAKDGTYERSWVDIEDNGVNVRHVFGIKYHNMATYKKYQAQYAHFRKSLEQFAD